MSELYRWKGKFVKKKFHNAILRRRENGKNRKSKENSEHDTQLVAKVSGNRIIDVEHMSSQMNCISCSEPLLLQNIEKETKNGAVSTFYVRCRNCLLVNLVKSGKEYTNPVTGMSKVPILNTKVALGAIHSGFGKTNINKFFATMDLPIIETKTFKMHERFIGPIIECVAKESCAEAAEMERFLTLESLEDLKKLLPSHLQDGYLVVSGDSSDSKRPTVRIFASYDMGWSQRGNGHTYDSLNGYCALIGLKTGKVLDYCTGNRKCRICDMAATTGKIKEHDCRLNFNGSARAMEADGAVQLVTNSRILKNANLQVGVFIGDNDSACISSIQNLTDYEIVKQSDMNHSTKGIGNLLHELHKDKSLDPDQELLNDRIKHIQRCFTYAVHQNKGQISEIKVALQNIPDHLYGSHENCNAWCQSKTDKENIPAVMLKNPILYKALKRTFLQLADNAEKFASAASSQPNESLNNSMCSKAPKSKCYSLSESADYRFSATVAQKNSGEDYLRRVMEKVSMPWSKTLVKRINDSDKTLQNKRLKSMLPLHKKRRLDLKARRSQLRNRKENTEGVTYRSNMGLLSQSTPNDQNCIEITADDVIFYGTDSLSIVFFDLETAGLSVTHEILQISMKCGKYIFNCYITPTQPININATKVNGFSAVRKQLFQNGQEVSSFSRKVSFQKVLEYSKLLKNKCVLVAHNCTFDHTRFVMAIKELSLVEEFEQIIEAFSDSLVLFRSKFPNRSTGYKLTTLASELLSLDCAGAHDAKFDVFLLEKLCVAYLDVNDLIVTKKSIADIMDNIRKNESIKSILSNLTPLKSIISGTMLKRLAGAGLSYQSIVHIYKTEGLDKIKSVLRSEVNGKATVIKTNKVLQTIVSHLCELP